jgi:hypothetical protein
VVLNNCDATRIFGHPAMAWPQYTSWTPLEGGDLGNQRPELSSTPSILVEDTSYQGASTINYGAQLNLGEDGCEMRDLREYVTHNFHFDFLD